MSIKAVDYGRMESSTVASPFIVNMLQGARESGYNVNDILAGCGISTSILREPRSRVTFKQLSDLSLALMRLLDDESYGLLPKPQRHNTFKLATYSAINADTIGKALGLISDFGNILDNGLSFSLQRGAKHTVYQLTRRTGGGIKNNYAIEHHLITIHRTLCWMADVRIALPWVNLDYPAPHYHSEYRYLFYGAPVRFARSHSALCFDKASMDLPNVRNIEQLKLFLRQIPLTLLSQTTAPRELSAQLRIWLHRQLQKKHRLPDINSAAARFDLHPQAMRRQLKKEDTSYQDIKMEVRRDLAVYLINRQDLSVETIAYQLDFSEPSAFIRAFKGWMGLTPLAYRKLST